MKYYRKKQIKTDYTKEEFTKCWTCQNACNNGCSWSRSFKPVEGWKAEKTYIESNGIFAESYNVIECPKYIEDRRY